MKFELREDMIGIRINISLTLNTCHSRGPRVLKGQFKTALTDYVMNYIIVLITFIQCRITLVANVVYPLWASHLSMSMSMRF